MSLQSLLLSPIVVPMTVSEPWPVPVIPIMVSVPSCRGSSEGTAVALIYVLALECATVFCVVVTTASFAFVPLICSQEARHTQASV